MGDQEKIIISSTLENITCEISKMFFLYPKFLRALSLKARLKHNSTALEECSSCNFRLLTTD